MGAWGNYDQLIHVEPGIYTFSLFVKTDSTDWWVYGTGIGDDVTEGSPLRAHFTVQSPEFKWFSYTFALTEAADIRPSVIYSTNGTYMSFCGYKLERGDTATPWTPAPQDIPTLSEIRQILNA